ncbi:unnamed protein product [Cladocopium goreaui]|uniref:Equilibrative nucleoside transporter 1 n=1 Tax=Cladocopium goreaui TaxID=2562237 RepID=A0A9P1DGN9_9DINO|nr:unnamed protein product [Cladocopium goreaui]
MTVTDSETWSIGSVEPVNVADPSQSRLLRSSFFYTGLASLLAWQVVLTFTHSFDCYIFLGRRFGGAGWAFWCSIVYSLAVNISQLILTSRTVVATIPFSFRWNVSSVSLALSLLGLLLCHVYTTPETIDTGFGVAVACTTLMGAASGVLQACAFGLAGSLSPFFAQDMMFGQGVGGMLSGIVGMALGTTKIGLMISFISSAIVQLGGIPVLFAMRTHPAVRARTIAVKPSGPQREISSSTDGASQFSSPMLNRARSSGQILVRNAWPQALTVCAVFTITFTIFPGVASGFAPGSRVPLLIAMFQMIDVVGRFAPQCSVLRIEKGWIVSGMAFARILFVPMFIAMQRMSSEAWAQNGFLQIGAMVLMAFSNGYVSTLSMMLGPEQTGVSSHEKEPVGTIMSLALVFGIFLGSTLAFFTQIGMVTTSCPSEH